MQTQLAALNAMDESIRAQQKAEIKLGHMPSMSLLFASLQTIRLRHALFSGLMRNSEAMMAQFGATRSFIA